MTLQRIKVAKGADGAVAVHPTVSDAGPAGGFTPGDLASAYAVDPNTATTGQVVGIVDAHDNPDALADLNAFDAQYGLPAETASSFRKIGQNGEAPPTNTSPPTDEELGWAGEIALDLEAVRGIYHTCRIVLVEANTSNFEDLAVGVHTAVSHGATVVSNSYGGYEGSDPGGPDDETTPAVQAAFNHPGSSSRPPPVTTATTTTTTSSTATLRTTPRPRRRRSPTSWPRPAPPSSSTTTAPGRPRSRGTATGRPGSPPSPGRVALRQWRRLQHRVPAPAWQLATKGWAQTACGDKRLTADVAALGDPLTGYDVYDTYSASDPAHAWGTFGGTSLSSPLIAAMFAMAGGGHGVPRPALTLYGHQKSDPGSLYDVASGGIGICDGLTAQNCAAFFPSTSPNTIGAGILDSSGSVPPQPGRPARGPATPRRGTTARQASARRTAWRRSSRWPRPRWSPTRR